jgi:hypothetical protein
MLISRFVGGHFINWLSKLIDLFEFANFINIDFKTNTASCVSYFHIFFLFKVKEYGISFIKFELLSEQLYFKQK